MDVDQARLQAFQGKTLGSVGAAASAALNPFGRIDAVFTHFKRATVTPFNLVFDVRP